MWGLEQPRPQSNARILHEMTGIDRAYLALRPSCCGPTSIGKHERRMWERNGKESSRLDWNISKPNQILFSFLAFWFNMGNGAAFSQLCHSTNSIYRFDWFQLKLFLCINLLPQGARMLLRSGVQSPKCPKKRHGTWCNPSDGIKSKNLQLKKSEERGSATPMPSSTATDNTQHKSSRQQPVNGQLTMTANPFTPKAMTHALVHNPYGRNLLAVKRCAKSRAPMQSLLCSKCG